MWSKKLLLLALLSFLMNEYLCAQQVFTLQQAIDTAIANYGTIKAKASYTAAANEQVKQARRDYLPNVNLSAQQDYGTINGQNGPMYGFGGLAASSSGVPLDHQNWNAAFGALYLTNINWDFFAFGRAKEKIKTAMAAATQNDKDWQQEIFRHKIKVAAAYLNLVAAQQLTRSFKDNMDRADTVRKLVRVRVLNHLIAGVDSSQANAEYSSARITWTKAKDAEQEQGNQLAQLLGVPAQNFTVDTEFVKRIPNLADVQLSEDNHPVLQWYKSRIALSDEQAKYYKTLYYPAFSVVGVLQTRGSGFGNNYGVDQHNFSQGYWDGVNPTRTNYLIGVGVTWNITQPLRISRQVKAQQQISKGLQYEYDLADQQIKAQMQLSDTKLQNALDNFREVPVQVKAASDAYLQKSVLYKNGLTNLVDLTQAAYALIRAQTDRDIAYVNVWQALLIKAAAAGDFNVFTY
ncbi:outer membrane protein TolC [Chitinophaga dinghuensis]|uniref:Outer membrane protein TolC n=1 Tax=Chitinophaga dinghuensis TaxID=1539050 RepID=A0A327WF99_9BACT|nr:TolC family protein [Chitinophaga dinghuensis]RAJ88056.1 outer membrane protein TolC [Chitinophaga dinghuensis]